MLWAGVLINPVDFLSHVYQCRFSSLQAAPLTLRIQLTHNCHGIPVCVCVCVIISMWAWTFAYKFSLSLSHTHTFAHTILHSLHVRVTVYACMHTCVCVCVCLHKYVCACTPPLPTPIRLTHTHTHTQFLFPVRAIVHPFHTVPVDTNFCLLVTSPRVCTPHPHTRIKQKLRQLDELKCHQ